ncbi:MAG: diguanylate cyclase [Herpetosiphonaceae bacterium]|nr:MAG: diguanylate cyclase [Herpetosiphonaceae bacterium]
MELRILGIHHVTAIAGNPQQNIDFYTGLLGLRLIKVTVNFDDPGTYHFYFGDDMGRPGTIMTFFPWPGAPRGRRGTGQVTTVAFSISGESLSFWEERLRAAGIAAAGPVARFKEQVLSFFDPDGLQLELVANKDDRRSGWAEGPVPAEHAIRGFYGVTMSIAGYERSASLLTEILGFRKVAESDSCFRYAVGEGSPGSLVDILSLPEAPRGQVSVGTIHHIAWRTANDEQQLGWREKLVDQGYNVTPVQDRQYFHSIYFREPGGVLFEIATDSPGFTVDESPEQLGTGLKLPAWLERQRQQIERVLPPLRMPASARER